MSAWSLAHPAWWAATTLLVLVVAVAIGRRPRPRLEAATLCWVADDPGGRPRAWRGVWGLKLLGLLLLGTALGGPQQWRPLPAEEQDGLALALVLDVSSSMARERRDGSTLLDQARVSLQGLVGLQEADQVALVCFAGEPTRGCPPTRDHDLVRRWLASAESVGPGSAEDRTGIGIALAQAAVWLEDVPARSRQVVLVTDGENNVDRIPPWEGTDLCRVNGIQVHAVAVGDDTADQQLLRAIAEATGGQAVSAADRAGLDQLLADLADGPLALEPAPVAQEPVDRAAWFGSFGLGLLLAAFLLERTWGLCLP